MLWPTITNNSYLVISSGIASARGLLSAPHAALMASLVMSPTSLRMTQMLLLEARGLLHKPRAQRSFPAVAASLVFAPVYIATKTALQDVQFQRSCQHPISILAPMLASTGIQAYKMMGYLIIMLRSETSGILDTPVIP